MTSSKGEPDSTLALALTLFLEKLETDDWSDRLKFAGIARDYTNLGIREVAGLLGVHPIAVREAPPASDPPWVLQHPNEHSTIRIRTWTEN